MSKSNVTLKFQGIQQFHGGSVSFNNNTVNIKGVQHNVEELSLDIPLRGTVYGTLLNYKSAFEKMEQDMHQDPYKSPPKSPVLYIKPANTIISSKSVIPLPDNVTELEMGAALGVVISKKATQVDENKALDHVLGYTVVNDVSIPHESFYRPAIKEKARDGFCPVGPWIIDAKNVPDPDNLGICVYINDELKQKNNTCNLIRGVSKLIADVTSFMTLDAGDTLLVGIPENVPLAKENDNVKIVIDGIGTLENTIRKEEYALGGGAV